MDFPSSIPFWIRIQGLPEYRCYEKGVVEIREKVGDLMAWEIQPSRVQVALEGGAPLILNRDPQFGNGDILTVHFKYERLDCYCKICYRLTHDALDRPVVTLNGMVGRTTGDAEGTGLVQLGVLLTLAELSNTRWKESCRSTMVAGSQFAGISLGRKTPMPVMDRLNPELE